MFETRTLLILIPAMPLAAALLCGLLGKRVLRAGSHVPVIAGLAISLIASLTLLYRVQHKIDEKAPAVAAGQHAAASRMGVEQVFTLWRWAAVPNAFSDVSREAPAVGSMPLAVWRHFTIDVTLRADPLTAVMLCVVTLVSLLVAIYSAGYMHDDPGYWRFFAYIGLFVFSMTMLVSVSNFLLLYVFWEAVGLCSYLLIGFWFQKPEAAAAGKKAFLVNRVGDFGFALGIFFLWTTYGTLDFHDTLRAGTVQTMGVLGQTRLLDPTLYVSGGLATAICLLLFLGACGKSAQLPLHVWLPDAMEGPTPVSALIHAATMVTAGVYMVARCAPLFAASPDALQVMAVVGGLTALMAAIIAVTQTDLKRILAYSTISQLGYMFMGLGAGTLVGATAGMFHLFTHAFFKALLFLGAGSVMHALGGVIDLDQFSGLRRRLPITHATFLVGALALAGAFPLAGFWSKDLILVSLLERAEAGAMLYKALYWLGVATASLTAFYAFRAYFRAFFGPELLPPEAEHHGHESPPSMTWPLVILAAGSLVVGAYFEWTHGFDEFLSHAPSLAYLAGQHAAEGGHGALHLGVMVQSAAIALAAIGLAAALYLGPAGVLSRLTSLMRGVGLYDMSREKFFVDPIYRLFIVWPLELIALGLAWVDRVVVDGLVDLCGRLPKAVGAGLRPLQSGLLPFYAMAMILGLLVLVGTLFM